MSVLDPAVGTPHVPGEVVRRPAPLQAADVAPQLEAACEGDWSLENLNVVGERIWNLERQFNLAAGFTAADDTLPKRLLTELAKTGPATGKVNELHKMLPEYYEARGWTTDGKPTPETLARLGL